jgi:hypothetical protein
MLPVANSAYTTVAPVIVANQVPANTRLLQNTIAPSVSSTQIYDHSPSSQAVTSGGGSASGLLVSFTNGGGTPAASSGAQLSSSSSFLTQLISQDAGSEAGGFLQAYEQLVQYSSVKYKPSNADLPQPKPTGTQAIIEQQAQIQVQAPPPPPVQIIVQQPVQQQAAAQTAQPTRAVAQQATQEEPATDNSPVELPSTLSNYSPRTAAPKAAAAYGSSIARNRSFAQSAPV